MASERKNSQAPNLAAFLLIKRRLAAKQAVENGDNQGQLQLPATNVGAHSVEKLSYHQIVPQVNSTAITHTNQSESPSLSRNSKQIEVALLDRKIGEINLKQENKTNATLDTWKDFESFNYGFVTESAIQQPKPMSPISQQEQRTSTPKSTTQIQPIEPIEEIAHQEPQVNQLPIEKYSSPILERSTSNNMDSPIRNQSGAKTPSKEEELRKETVDKPFVSSPLPPKTINEKRKSSPEVYTPIHSAPSLDSEKTYEYKQPQSLPSNSPIPMIEQTVPITSIIANPNIFQNNSQSLEQPSSPVLNRRAFKLFPDIKRHEAERSKHGLTSIQRSMDRYRFHVW
ncbi:unnamed protein product [Rotaria socialis]|uniref:Uncharacterized protein n=1 Tax=Rotaria socialis TaxID=392032 RepID=A0A820D895_9BILA|nr:unnamed protein product [Rotaria socialis]CAF4221289.1 unnamed protein product [Rotaria socialis]CAF4314993.1 unnamed protein product [Rotaria socialis]CAF4641029.1 unnamed protein product [Rotaria socialis]